MWNEKGAVEELLEKHQLDNIYILPNNLNMNLIVNLVLILLLQKAQLVEFSLSWYTCSNCW
jgi:hypothetical protein